jgi:hypothetical protein
VRGSKALDVSGDWRQQLPKGQGEWRIMVQIGCLCPLPKEDAFLELVRGSKALDVPGDWRPQLRSPWLALETH